MDKKKTLAALAFCLSTGPLYAANDEVDLRTLKLLEEEGVSYEEFQQHFGVSDPQGSSGNYSRFSISNGNYSRFSISDSNYSRFSISDGNYSRFSISDANYSRFSISGGMPAMTDSNSEIPGPILATDEEVGFLNPPNDGDDGEGRQY